MTHNEAIVIVATGNQQMLTLAVHTRYEASANLFAECAAGTHAAPVLTFQVN